jgi:hypothetical protein
VEKGVPEPEMLVGLSVPEPKMFDRGEGIGYAVPGAVGNTVPGAVGSTVSFVSFAVGDSLTFDGTP